MHIDYDKLGREIDEQLRQEWEEYEDSFLPYHDKTDNKKHPFYAVECHSGRHGCSETFYFDREGAARGCAEYGTEYDKGGWSSVTLRGLEKLPAGETIADPQDWL